MRAGGLEEGDPTRVGRWNVSSRLGAGGMGNVFLGSDGDRLAAIKVIAPGLAADEAFRARFRREVAFCRRVTGPQIAELFDADTETDQPWLAVRYVPGPTLSEAVRSHGPLQGAPLRGFATATAEALRQIHDAGVVHRDLKPSNIILTPATPVIIDFGIAGASDATSLTATGTVMGSAGWMAPEQILGAPVGPEADVFAWAAVVAFAATGRPPFGEGRPEALTYRVVHGEADLEGIDHGLRSVLASALSRDPAARPSVGDLLDLLAGGHSSADAATTIAQTWDGVAATVIASPPISVPLAAPVRKGRWPTLAAAAGVALIVAVAATAFALSRGRTGTEARTERPEKTTSTNAAAESIVTSAPVAPTTEPSPTTTATPTTEPAPVTTVPEPVTTVPPPPSARSFDYLNHTYDISCGAGDAPITLTDGQWTAPGGDPTQGGIDSIAVDYADVTSDGAEDAVVTIGCGIGAGNVSGTTLVYSSRPDGLTQVGQPIPAFGRANAGKVVTETPSYAPEDPMCCPSMYERSTWRLRNGGWSEEEVVRITAEQAFGE